MSTIKRIPVYEPYLSGNIKEYVNDCLDSSWISSKGKYIDKFEKAFAEFIDVKYATTVSNGTVALQLALLSLDIKEGDEVITPSFTYVATANSIRHVNATPVFADCDINTWQMNMKHLKDLITPKTKAVICVHLYGQACKVEELRSFCDEHNLFLVEDCAEAIGTEYNGKKVGTFGHISTFSFYGNKTITTGEGGMVVSNDKDLIDRTFLFKMQGVSPTKRYWHEVIGYNFRMTNICAAIGLSQLEMIDEIMEQKIRLAKRYIKNLKGSNFQFQGEYENSKSTYWMFSILTPDNNFREKLIEYLDDNNIETRPLFYPAHVLPMYANLGTYNLPNSENIGYRGLNLPSYPTLKDEEIDYICGKILSFQCS